MCLNKRFFILSFYIISINLFGVLVRFSNYVQTKMCFNCEDPLDKKFDYIVVGCGSAGAIVANRLSQNGGNQILILEAGNEGNFFTDIPPVGLLLQETTFDWQYKTVPQKSSCFSLDNHSSRWPMGKIVGGTSMLNNMIYVRGHPKDFADWFKYDESYQNYENDILPYFNKLETLVNDDTENGSIFISDLLFTSKLPEYIFNAAKSLGFSIYNDNVDCKTGFTTPKANLHKSKRWTSAHTIKTQKRSNLVIATNRIVEKVIFEQNYEAHTVKYNYLGNDYYAKARKGIILCAGVIGTPKILMLSGIGNQQHLNDVGVEAIIDLPVGDNLQDHVTTGFDLVLLNQTLDVGIAEMLSPSSIYEYFWQGAGPWTTGGCEALAFINTSKNTEKQPDLQFMIMPLGITEDNGVHLRRLFGISDDVWSKYFARINVTAITILPVLLHPKSKGSVRLNRENIHDKPIIDPNYLSHPDDIDVLIDGIEIIKKLIDTESMKKLGAKLNANVFPGCERFTFDTKPYWKCYVEHLTITSYHPVGTCKMGGVNDVTSVVNYNFQVKNTNKLYAVDGSVLPTLTSGNINGAIMMLAEMASDAIKYGEWLGNTQSETKEMFIPKLYC